MRNSPAVHIQNQDVVKNNFLCGIYVVKPNFNLYANSSGRSSAKRSLSLSANSFKLLSALFGKVDPKNQQLLNMKNPEFLSKLGVFGAANQI